MEELGAVYVEPITPNFNVLGSEEAFRSGFQATSQTPFLQCSLSFLDDAATWLEPIACSASSFLTLRRRMVSPNTRDSEFMMTPTSLFEEEEISASLNSW